MSTSKLISRESIEGVERWELPDVADPRARKNKAMPKPKVSEEEIPDEQAPRLTAEEIERIQKEAYDEGYQAGFDKGHKDGVAAGQKEVRAEAQKLTQAFKSLARPLDEVDEQVESELLELALAVARQLIRRELKTSPDEIIAVVREAIEALPANTREVRVRLNPDDAALVREHVKLGEGEEPAWTIVEDPALSRGGCKLQSENSYVDASLEKRLNAVVAKLFGGERSVDDESGE